MFTIMELVIIVAFLYFTANLCRYIFFRESRGMRGLFGLSDAWLKADERQKEKKK